MPVKAGIFYGISDMICLSRKIAMALKSFIEIWILCFACFLFTNVATAQKQDTAFQCKLAEEMPEFPGGSAALVKYIDSSIHYPDAARSANASGKVILTFTIRKDGTITDVKVLRDLVGYGCAEEAKRIVSTMPKWSPGKKNGVLVNVYYTIPIRFKLED